MICKIKGKKLIYLYLIILDIAIFLYMYGVGMANATYKESTMSSSMMILYGFLGSGSLLAIIKYSNKISYKNPIIVYSILYFIYYFLRMYLWDERATIENVLSQSIWEILLITGYIFSSIQNNSHAVIKICKIQIILLNLCCIIVTTLLMPHYSNFFMSSKDMYFALIFFIPFLSILPFSKLKLYSCLLLELFALISLKRSIIIIISIIVLILLYKELKRIRNGNFYLITMTVIIAIFLCFGDNDVLSAVSHRMDSLATDGGSGRAEMWTTLWGNYINSDFTGLLFGLGYSAVYDLIKIAAHNDILQILVNCGLIGLFFYLMIYYGLIGIARKKFKFHQQPLGIAIMLSFICLAFISNTNCFIINPPLISPFMFSLGFLIGASNNKKLAKV